MKSALAIAGVRAPGCQGQSGQPLPGDRAGRCARREPLRADSPKAHPPPDAAALAASYGYGISRNHPFIDGNKRTGYVAAELFLRLNGWRLTADDASCVVTMLAVAAGDITEEAFAAWLRAHAVAC